ncbi:MAG: FKBP-type peptidyl-prolyl cis-trans isomerase [Crocinitomicaceae bacterium]|nr:FKBP-type peptidyl-prolyl cis-trans isomerase [Crocinitomicaceae bacterium]
MTKFLKFSGLLALLLIVSCNKEDNSAEQAAADDAKIQQYISDHGLTATPTGSGLYVVIDNPGFGASCNSNSDVKVAYTGYYTDGINFDQSLASGIVFNLQGVIQGWTEGIPYFNEGGSGTLLIPSALGYGSSGSGSVPANAVLIFDIELIEVL